MKLEGFMPLSSWKVYQVGKFRWVGI